MIIKPGYCAGCWFAESDREELDDLMSHGRLPRGSLRRFGLTKCQARYHRKHLGRVARLVYYTEPEWTRRKRSVARIRRYCWKPGESGNPKGRPRGAKDKKPRRSPQGIAASIREERAERARLQWLRISALAQNAQ